MTQEKKSNELFNKKILIFIVIFSFAFLCSFLVREDKIENLLSNLPNILGILLAGVLASLAILFGLLSDDDLSKIRQRNIRRSEEQKCEDNFILFQNSVKDDTIIIFISFLTSFFLTIIVNMDLTKIPIIYSFIPMILSMNFKFFLLMIGLSVFIISVSCVFDIIDCVFILNQERYNLSRSTEKQNESDLD